MIFRKPYAFFIKNFKKIHLVLILVCAYIFYKHLQVYSFVKEYVDLETYSAFLEPISKYTSILAYLAIIFVVVVASALLITLKRKEKPWKLYLVIVGEYLVMLFVFVMTTNFFNTYDDNTAVTQILAIRDLLLIASIPQYLVFIILFIRFTGIDLNKFSFATDKEYLELDSSDREEVEVSFEIDKHAIKRLFRRLKRNIGYVYQEHRFIINTLGGIFVAILVGYSYYYFGIVHKTYKEGQTLQASDYAITVQNAYLSDKDYKGDRLDGDHYVVVGLTVKNNGARRVMNTDRFHLVNRNYDIVSTSVYDQDFNDLGDPYQKREFQPGKSYDFILIFKTPSKLDVNKYALYYQEYISAQETYLRKIKLKVNDVRQIKEGTPIPLTIEETLVLPQNKKRKLAFNSMLIGQEFPYNYYTCTVASCFNDTKTIKAAEGKKLMKIDFTSLDFTGQELIDFSMKYGKIIYKDSNQKKHYLKIKNSLTKDYLNNSLYLKVPANLDDASEISLQYTIRNNRYIFKLR